MHSELSHPQILAPAGNRDSFLAAVAAGADAVYCGLKRFSARMEARNFSIEELAVLTNFAHQNGVQVFVTLNSLVRTNELDDLSRTIDALMHHVSPDAFIVQDLGTVTLAGRLGFQGDIHLSTLANVSFPEALKPVSMLPHVRRVVLPRELGIDEIRQMAEACPADLGLEVFVHGALCYGVSGRCYWSSFLGGKSGLRGSCVQPCRRRYTQAHTSGRSFSCLDMSLDVLTKLLLHIPQIRGWKIEGRKKGPHYVYQTVSAYRLFRDHPSDGAARKEAVELLQNALGRPTTHYRFLDHRPQHPITSGQHTGSGKRIGKVVSSSKKRYILAFEPLEPGDTVRIGYEDDRYHALLRIDRLWIAGSRIPLDAGPSTSVDTDTPVFLTDRRQRRLESILKSMHGALFGETATPTTGNRSSLPSKQNTRHPEAHDGSTPKGRHRNRRKASEMILYRMPPERFPKHADIGCWLSSDPSDHWSRQCWIWLPPVVWPKDAAAWQQNVVSLVERGYRRFVLNMPYQIAWFQDRTIAEEERQEHPTTGSAKPPGRRGRSLLKGSMVEGLELWAGPFCNASNPLAVTTLQRMGFCGVIVSPELGRDDYLVLAERSPLPLGIVLSGLWPLSISRIVPQTVLFDQPIQSPKGETCFLKNIERNTWMFPNWELHLERHRNLLEEAGYRLFVHCMEPLPEGVHLKHRPGLWNWENGLL